MLTDRCPELMSLQQGIAEPTGTINGIGAGVSDDSSASGGSILVDPVLLDTADGRITYAPGVLLRCSGPGVLVRVRRIDSRLTNGHGKNAGRDPRQQRRQQRHRQSHPHTTA